MFTVSESFDMFELIAIDRYSIEETIGNMACASYFAYALLNYAKR